MFSEESRQEWMLHHKKNELEIQSLNICSFFVPTFYIYQLSRYFTESTEPGKKAQFWNVAVVLNKMCGKKTFLLQSWKYEADERDQGISAVTKSPLF